MVITYSLPASCPSATRSAVTVTVNPTASISSVTGTTPLLAGTTATYTANTVVLGGGSGAWSSSNTGVATVNSSTGVVTAVAAGTCNIVYTITSGCGGTVSALQSLTVYVPTITTAGTMTAFSSCAGTAASPQSFTASGSNLSADITVTAPTGFEISTNSGSGYGTSLTLTQSGGTFASTTIYVRMSAAATGSPSGNVTLASTGATTKNVAASGTAVALSAVPSPVTATPSTLCPGVGASSNLNAQSAGNIIYWYTAATGGTLLGSSASGANYSVNPATTTAYYAEAAPDPNAVTTVTKSYTGTMDSFTVPAGITSLTIDAMGAQGGSATTQVGGKGVRAKGTVTVIPGQVLKILVGGQGANHANMAGGGGGTFVTDNSNSPLMVAGGGGGALDPYYPGNNAVITTNGGDGTVNNIAAGGTNGSGGGGSAYGSGGGGLLTNGSASTNTYAHPGSSFINGGAGGSGTGSSSGGFGGGASGDYSWNGISGAGGGYSGGGGGYCGGGGGSYNAGTNQTMTAGYQTGNGQVVITYNTNPTVCPSASRTAVTVTVNPNASIASVTGTTPLLVGTTATYGANTAVLGGNGTGAWSSSNTGVATVNSSTGVVTAIAAGTCNIVYTITGGCGGTVSALQSLTVYVPTITTSGTLSAFASCAGTASSSQSFTASGSGLSADITVTAPTGFEVSTSSGSGYGTSLTLTQTAGTVSSTTIYVRMTAAATGSPAGNIALTSTGATTKNVAASGTAVALPTVPSSVTATPSSFCTGTGTSSNLNATSAGNTINWYTDATGGTLLGSSTSGANYSVTPTNTTTYYAEAQSPSTLSQTFNYSGSIVNFTVPAGVTSITIDAMGAGGGNANASYGKGARMQGTVAVTPGTTLKILVGGKGGANSFPGGGGGTFVTNNANSPLVVAGGGGGYGGGGYSGSNAGTGTSGNNAQYTNSGGVGGTGGGAGQANSCSYNGGPGGGLTGEWNSYYGAGGYGGRSFINGGAGGAKGSYSPASEGAGGFGGGGGAGMHSGGGGGYSGGGGSANCGNGGTYDGGGGGSYNAGTNQTNTAGYNQNDGQVVITYSLAASCPSATRLAVTVTVNPNASIASVTGTTPLLGGTTATYTANAFVLGGGSGAWSSSNTAVATVNSSTGIVTAVAAGTCNIVYTITSGCGGTVSAQQALTVVVPPTITSFSPTSAATGATVTITGTHFTDASAVSFGGTAATSYNVVSATSITAVVAGGTTGSVSVTTPVGTATSTGSFTYIACSDPTSGGTISGTQTICSGFVPVAFTSSAAATGYTGTLEYKWQLSTTSSVAGFSDIASSNSATYAPGTLSATTWYKRLARVSCMADWTGAVASNVLQITVNQPSFSPGTFTVANLQATGSNIQWYAAASGGTALATSTALVNGTHYYASQTVNGVESTDRYDATAIILQTPCPPTATTPQIPGAGATVANLTTLTGQSIRWYTVATGGTALPASTALLSGTHTYYASQTVSCTESASRMAVVVTLP